MVNFLLELLKVGTISLFIPRIVEAFRAVQPTARSIPVAFVNHHSWCPAKSDVKSFSAIRTELNGIFRNPFKRKSKSAEEKVLDYPVTLVRTLGVTEGTELEKLKTKPTEKASICIIGGGVSGLAAALAAANATVITEESKIILLEASDAFGGRVRSDVTDDGFVLDRGFAVFIEEYPWAKTLFDYEALKLGKFQPGALVKVSSSDQLQRVADPLRQPEDFLTALMAQVGTVMDKIALLPLIYTAQTTSIEDIFLEEEIDTLTALKVRYGFSEDILEKFFRPFLEGIYLAPLSEQSSRMFLFVFKMFSEGYAALPEGGIGNVAKQLVEKGKEKGIDLRVGSAVANIVKQNDGYLVQTADGESAILAETVVIAVEGPVAQKLVAGIEGFESIATQAEQPQRSVGCLYYSFKGPAPVQEPILILNGMESRGTSENPVNNVCFPSVVARGYAPEGYNLCSVTVLKNAMDAYKGREDDLDSAVRKQLGTWFPNYKDDILTKWELKCTYDIKNAQPSQLGGPTPANVNGGRDCNKYRGKAMPSGVFICGDTMATATLNGALESGIKAGTAAANAVN